MKPYGHRRTDARTCQYGCCGGTKANVSNRDTPNRKRVDKAARHRARQLGKKDSFACNS